MSPKEDEVQVPTVNPLKKTKYEPTTNNQTSHHKTNQPTKPKANQQTPNNQANRQHPTKPATKSEPNQKNNLH